MSILIKGITKSDFENILTEARYGTNNCMIGNGVEAIELPPHGRLSDADVLFREISKRTNAAYEWRKKATDEDIKARADATYMAFVEVALTISKLPTIIEAEEGE